MTTIHATPIIPGAASGQILAADSPLSFWGGYDPVVGQIIDRRHPLVGQMAIGRILVIPSGRGSCSGSGILLEAIRNNTAPAAIITSSIDPIISLGAILGDELYARSPILAVVSDLERSELRTGDWLTINQCGRITLISNRANL